MSQNSITKEYIDKRFHEFSADMHIMTSRLSKNAEAYYEIETERHMGAFKEELGAQVQVALDQVKGVTDKTDAFDARLCILEKTVL
jgi:hypothetical protein